MRIRRRSDTVPVEAAPARADDGGQECLAIGIKKAPTGNAPKFEIPKVLDCRGTSPSYRIAKPHPCAEAPSAELPSFLPRF